MFWHSLEHLPNAGEELERVVDLLAPDGVLLIAVPNSDGLQARILGDRWFALDLPRHLVHLSARALVQRLQALGLKVERVSSWRGGQVIFGWLHGIVGILPGHPDLYEAIRRPEARRRSSTPHGRLLVLAAEVALRRGGTVYVECRRARHPSWQQHSCPHACRRPLARGR